MLEKQNLVDLLIASGYEIAPADVVFDVSFKNLGMDSLDVFNFFTEIESGLGVEIPDEDFAKLKSMNDTFGYLQNKLGASEV